MMAPAATREEELHWRRIDMRGWRRSDGLFELEGRVTDRKPHEFQPWHAAGQPVPAGDAIHDMGVRLVFDRDLCIHGVQTFTEAAPYAECPEGGRALQTLVGLRMTSGWTKEVRSRLGGPRACTHLMELLIPMATTAFQSLSMVNRGRADRVDADGRPVKIDTCYAYGAERELVRMVWPQFHRPSAEPGDT
jgi:hypothetical protein